MSGLSGRGCTLPTRVLKYHGMRIPRWPTLSYRRNGGNRGEGLYWGMEPRVVTVIKVIMNIKLMEEKCFSVYTEYPFLQNVFGRAPPTRASTSYQEKSREDKQPMTSSSYLEAFCFNQLHFDPGHYRLMITLW